MAVGNVYNSYDKDFIKKYVHVRGCYIRDLAQIHLISEYLEKIECTYRFMSMFDLSKAQENMFMDADNEVGDILEFYKDTVMKFKPSIYSSVFNNNNWANKTRIDPHPLPNEHLKYLDKVLPEFAISRETREWVAKEDIIARDMQVNYKAPIKQVERL